MRDYDNPPEDDGSDGTLWCPDEFRDAVKRRLSEQAEMERREAETSEALDRLEEAIEQLNAIAPQMGYEVLDMGYLSLPPEVQQDIEEQFSERRIDPGDAAPGSCGSGHDH